ncbi:hypothetical protein CYMTET_3235 [Cymbomonas tetramitiformis]|uniref:DUF7869 domain-containing protein n=1 Tax=Cymbomonas tetramitiformis TaxID=36881 RepID=A0AAE0LL24_9CHLO|nr:hypothetical protein CYMTET_3235 [Cymbomonas tetramitiformis]
MHSVVLFMCLLMPWVPGKDVNMCLTTFNILLRYVATETTRFFRPTCHVQMDGGSENWNRHVFGFFCYLVHYGLYKEIYLHRLPVGHSHNDVDGFFGLLKMKLWGKTADALGYWFITLQEWIHFLVSWVIETVNKQTAIVGCNLDFKTWLDPHLNEDFGSHAGRNRHVHNWCFYIAPDGNVRAMYNFGDRFSEWLPTGVEKNRNLGLILCTSYPAIDSAPDYVDNPSWIRKGQGDKKLDMEKTTQSCMEGLRASTPELVSQKQHEQLAATFPLPLTVESVRERTPERIPPVWNLPLLLTRAHTEAGTIVPDKTLKSRYTLDKQFEVCFDGVNRKRKDVEKEAEKHIDVQEIVMFMRQSKYSTQLISRRAPAPAAPAPARRRRQPPSRKRALSTPPSTDEDEDGSSSDSDVDLATRARLRSQRPAPRNRQVRKQPKKAVSTPPRSSVGTDGDDDESSDDDLEESLADRKKRVMEEKEALPDDYTFEDMTPGSFAATVAGGEDKDKCWFTIQLPNGGTSVPIHFVEVVARHASTKEITWQFWVPAKRQRNFTTVEGVCVAGAFVRGPDKLRMKSPFDVGEVFTCWDKNTTGMSCGAVPAGDEKAELLKALVENRVV